MCTPKIPTMDVQQPAPPPPSPEASAAYSQGSPATANVTASKKKTGSRNSLRIDRKPKSNLSILGA